MVWSNDKKVFHGTIETQVAAITSGINPAAGRLSADFGRGFYVTTDLHQGRQLANQKVRSLPRSSPRAAVLEFEFDRDLAAVASEQLSFVLADTDFYDFVQFNRFGSASLKRASGNSYDVIHGPVAAHPQTIAFAGCDQICFVAAGKNVANVINALRYVGVTYGTPLI